VPQQHLALPPPERKQNVEDLLQQFIQSSDIRHRNQEASIHNLEKQIGQLAKMLSERAPGSLPGNTEANPKEQVKAVMIRSGRELHDQKVSSEKVEEKGEDSDIIVEEKKEQQEKSVEKDVTLPVKEYQPPLPYPSRLKNTR